MERKFEEPFCDQCEQRFDSIFKDLGQQHLKEMSWEKGCGFYKKGRTIFVEGNKPTNLYCMHKGKVKITKIGEEGRDQIVRFAKPGDVLGYRSLISGERYSASATALEDCVICSIPKRTFFDILEENPDLSLQLMRIFSDDLRSAEHQLTNLTQKSVKERIAEALLILQQTYGTNTDGFIDVELKRVDIANIVGTTTESAIRLLSEMKKEGLIEVEDRLIKILQPNKLSWIGNVVD